MLGKIIQGFLFTSEDLHNHWHTLDEFEGAEYERVPVEVTTSTGETVQSCIYMLKA
ncbi:gamma-glutamylcyclotransferase family protein [Klebsiella variicola]|uniref:gamma-glutamylcyclotransferase family protein n=1 Tax=Klebsiella variicola TaxID=244366 RepID=UPI001D19589A